MNTPPKKIYYIKRAAKEYLKDAFNGRGQRVAFWIREQGKPPFLTWASEIPTFTFMINMQGARLIFEDKDSLTITSFYFLRLEIK